MKAVAGMSGVVRSLNEEKGVLYEELRRLAIVARHVAPAEASLFAVSTHLRASRKVEEGRQACSGSEDLSSEPAPGGNGFSAAHPWGGDFR